MKKEIHPEYREVLSKGYAGAKDVTYVARKEPYGQIEGFEEA